MAPPEGLLPGFRFHPTDKELVTYYLKRKIHGLRIEPQIIPVVDLYKSDPSDLQEKSFMPSSDSERPTEFYLFAKWERKYPIGFRTNRATPEGYWKSTGKDRRVLHNSAGGGGGGAVVGMKKTLVYHRGRAPQGLRTEWIMHEYRLHDEAMAAVQPYVLCRVFNKKAGVLQLQGLPSGDGEGCYGNGIPSAPPPEVPVADHDDYSWIDQFLSDDVCAEEALVD